MRARGSTSEKVVGMALGELCLPIATHQAGSLRMARSWSPDKAEISFPPISPGSEFSEKDLEGEFQDIFLIEEDQNKLVEKFRLMVSKCFIFRMSKHCNLNV